MKKIGLIGGMSWVSTLKYYEVINQVINKELGGEHSAELVLCATDFSLVSALMHKRDWVTLANITKDMIRTLEAANVDFYLFCCNTIHGALKFIQTDHLPLLHILDPVSHLIDKRGYNRILLLGSKFTMEDDFHKNYLKNNFNFEVIIPQETERDFIHDMIFQELCFAQFSETSKEKLISLIQTIKKRDHIETVLLACTELSLVASCIQNLLPVYDTTQLHAEAAAFKAIGKIGYE